MYDDVFATYLADSLPMLIQYESYRKVTGLSGLLNDED